MPLEILIEANAEMSMPSKTKRISLGPSILESHYLPLTTALKKITKKLLCQMVTELGVGYESSEGGKKRIGCQ